MHLKLLEKQELIKPQIGRKKERIRVEIKEMETKKIQRINETKVGSFGK
jgi:hypothetical protein